MNVDFILVGQGISGTMMYRFLKRAGYKVMVIDEAKPNTASRVASGVINPVTGRRIVKTWLIDEVMPFASSTYESVSDELKIDAIKEVSIVDFFPTPQITEAFKKRFAEDKEFLSMPADPGKWSSALNYEFGFGEIMPAYLVNLPDILSASRHRMIEDNELIQQRFEESRLQLLSGGVRYVLSDEDNSFLVQINIQSPEIDPTEIESSYIIFCDGIGGTNNPYFSNLPFAPNKGEALLVEIKDLPTNHIYKKGFSLVPWKDNIFWLGSNYLWEFENDSPTPGYYRFAEHWLKQNLKVPFNIIDHLAGIRPATLERRPFIGFHPVHQQIGIFNGMGAKGCSLAPFFANQFVNAIISGKPVYKEADVKRFTRILSRNPEI